MRDLQAKIPSSWVTPRAHTLRALLAVEGFAGCPKKPPLTAFPLEAAAVCALDSFASFFDASPCLKKRVLRSTKPKTVFRNSSALSLLPISIFSRSASNLEGSELSSISSMIGRSCSFAMIPCTNTGRRASRSCSLNELLGAKFLA